MADIFSYFPLRRLLVGLQRGREPSVRAMLPSCVIDCRVFVPLFEYKFIIIIIIIIR
jgi:hypothetical protein